MSPPMRANTTTRQSRRSQNQFQSFDSIELRTADAKAKSINMPNGAIIIAPSVCVFIACSCA